MQTPLQNFSIMANFPHIVFPEVDVVPSAKRLLDNKSGVGYWKELSSVMETFGPCSTDPASAVNWLNRVVQVLTTKGYQVAVESSVQAHSCLILARFVYTTKNVVVIAGSYAQTKLEAKVNVALALSSLYKCRFTSADHVLHPAGDSVQVGQPVTDEIPTEQIQDTAVMAITNPVSKLPAAPFPPSAKIFASMSSSVPYHDMPSTQERELYYGKIILRASDTFAKIIPFVRGSGDESPNGIRIPQDLLQIPGATAATPYTNFVFHETVSSIRVHLNVPPNAQGYYVFTTIPAPEMQIGGANSVLTQWLHPNLIFQREGLGASVLDLGTQNDVQVTIPFNIPANLLYIESSENPLSAMRNSGMVSCVCVSPFKTGDTNLQDVEASVWIQCRSVRMTSMRYDKTPTATFVNDDDHILYPAGAGISTAVGDVWNFVESIPVIGSVANTIGNVIGEFAVGADRLILGSEHADRFADNLAAAGVISDKDKDKGGGASIFGSLARSRAVNTQESPSLRPLRKAPLEQQYFLPGSNTCLANVSDSTHSHRLGGHSQVQTLEVENGGMTISELVQRPNLLKTIPVTTSMTQGTILARFSLGLVNPDAAYNVGSLNTLHGGPICLGAGLFAFYAGKKVFFVKVVKTALHALSLAFAATPCAEVVDNTEAGSQYFHVMDFNDVATGTYDCPYVDAYATRRSPLSTIYTDKRPGEAPGPGESTYTTTVPFTGEVALILVNPLVVTGATGAALVSNTVDVLVFEYMDQGAMFWLPVAPNFQMLMAAGTTPPTPAELLTKCGGR